MNFYYLDLDILRILFVQPPFLESIVDGEFIGFVGLLVVSFEAHFTPAIEIGWRLDSQYWGKGYATEAAKAVVDFAFTILKLEEVVSFTVENNIRSRRVMKKIGMQTLIAIVIHLQGSSSL